MNNIQYWELINRDHLNNIFNIVTNNLNYSDIIIVDEKQMYNQMIELFYFNFKKTKIL